MYEEVTTRATLGSATLHNHQHPFLRHIRMLVTSPKLWPVKVTCNTISPVAMPDLLVTVLISLTLPYLVPANVHGHPMYRNP